LFNCYLELKDLMGLEMKEFRKALKHKGKQIQEAQKLDLNSENSSKLKLLASWRRKMKQFGPKKSPNLALGEFFHDKASQCQARNRVCRIQDELMFGETRRLTGVFVQYFEHVFSTPDDLNT